MGAIDIPNTAGDDAIKMALIDVVCRCLVRSEGAYCRRRSSGYSQPAIEVVKDLRHIRNSLFLMVYAENDVSRYRQQQASDQAARNAADKAHGAQLMRELELKNDETKAISRKLAWWRVSAACCLGVGVAACGATWWSPLTAAGAPVPVMETLESSESPQAAQTPPIATTPAVTPSPPEVPPARAPTGPPAPALAVTPSPEVTFALSESAAPKSDPPPTDVQAPRKRAGKPMTAPTGKVTMMSRAKLGQEKIFAVCKPASDSAQKHGTITVHFTLDATTKRLSEVALAYTSEGLKLADGDCVKALKTLPMLADFSLAEDFKTSFMFGYLL